MTPRIGLFLGDDRLTWFKLIICGDLDHDSSGDKYLDIILRYFSGATTALDKVVVYQHEIDSPRVSSGVSFDEEPFVEDGASPVLGVGRQTRGWVAHKPLRHVHVVAEERPTHQDLSLVWST